MPSMPRALACPAKKMHLERLVDGRLPRHDRSATAARLGSPAASASCSGLKVPYKLVVWLAPCIQRES